MYRIGVNRDLYIFECLFRNLMEVTQEAGAEIHLMLMTNAANDAETKAFLKAHDYFGYNPDYVHFFVQEMAPVIDAQQQILLTSPDKIAMSPNGNGGWFSSMYHAGLLPMIESAGIQWLNVFAVDNVLQRMADPVFIGATIDSGCACGGKVVAKAAPEERVGVLCLEDGKPSIVEYFEMTDAMRTQREPDGRLSYNYGVILNYLFRTDALMKTLSQKLPLHMAHKAVAYVDASGTPIKPDKPNAYKFETLVLDMIHMQDSCMAFEVDREREFAPVKNREGVDSVDTARELLRKNGVQL
jgi:UDP-N-acetylglucosamine/UDP-N-acetylgalactosamine diphosphorylase